MLSASTRDPQELDAWACSLGISSAALDLYLASDVIDLHVDTFIWTRIFGYDLRRRHGLGPLRGRFLSQADLPRMRAAAMSGAMWSITTSPLRGPAGRARAFVANLARLQATLASAKDETEVVSSYDQYVAVRASGRMASFLAIQGGNALAFPAALNLLEDSAILRVTLVHLSNSELGGTSSPFSMQSDRGLTEFGRDYIRELNRRRILVDLAHIGRRGFAEACEVHDPSLPLVVTHTGVGGVHPCWRNLDDDQIKRVADTGGVVGIIFHSAYLNGAQIRRARAADVAAHLAHVVRSVGEDHAAIGSDYDGFIVPPSDLRTCTDLPLLAQSLLDCGLTETAVHKLLGQNFLRVLRQLRG